MTPGAKSAMGAAQQIISQMPPHRIYVEGFGGTGAVIARKAPAKVNIVIEKSGLAAARMRATMPPSVIIHRMDFFDYAAGTDLFSRADTLVYLDPPYVKATRRSARNIYAHEFTDDDHRRLAALASAPTVRARIIISGYAGSLYEQLFAGWRRHDFQVMTRGGPATESLWMNYAEPSELHDTRFVGAGFTDRQRIKRKAARWVSRLLAMEPKERAAILAQIDLYRPTQSMATVAAATTEERDDGKEIKCS